MMHEIVLDILLPAAAIALVGLLLHNEKQVNGALATVTNIYKTGVGYIGS